jgi:PAS domain S-box-containing protein
MDLSNPSRKFFWQFAGITFLFALVIAIGCAYYGFGKRELIRQEHEKLYAIADLKAKKLHTWLTERKVDAALIRDSLPVAFAFTGYLESGSERDKFVSLQCLEALKKTNRYRAAFLVDNEGRTMLSTDRGETLSANDISVMRQSLSSEVIRLSDIEMDGQGKPELDIIAPLFNNTSKSRLGTLVMRIDPETYLYPSLRDWPTPSTSAETFIVRRDGDDVLFLNELRYRKNAALSLRIPINRTDLPAAMIIRGVERTVEGYDYRGVKVLFAGKAVAGTPWFLIAKIDSAEVYAPLYNRAVISMLLSLLSFMASAALLWVMWRKREAEFLRIELWEQARAAAEIAESEENLAVTLASIGDAVIATDDTGMVTRMNTVAEQLTGWPLAEAIGRPLEEVFLIVNEDTRLPVENPVHKVLETGRIIGLANHIALIARDGSELPIADSGAPIRDKGGKVLGVVLVFRDQTNERHREREIINARDSLKESEKLLRKVFEAVPDMILVVDRARRVIHSNWHGKAHGLLQEFRGHAPYCHEVLHKELGTFCDSCQTLQVLASGKPCMAEMTLLDNQLFEVSSHPIFDDSGAVKLVVQNLRDVTERNRLEEQLRHSQKMEAIGTLAGGIAHDFNNILTVIVGYGDILAMKLPKDDPLHNDVAKIMTAANRATALTKGLLAYSRKGVLNLRNLEINDVVTKIDRLLSRIIGEDINLTVKPCNGRLHVMADEGQIEQVLMNLASNARDSMQNGGDLQIEVKKAVIDSGFIAVHGYGRDGDYALISVSDNGTGMNEAIRERAFEPFFTTKEVGKGTGLGLAIVYGIVKQHGGFINVYSEPGQGTTFSIYLPLSDSAPESRHRHEGIPVWGNGETILLIEDNEEIRTVFGTLLEEFGYRVIDAADGEKGLEVFTNRQEEIDLLLLDIIMPRKNGRETFDAIRALKPEVKALFMSGYAADVISCKGIDTEGLELLSKPFSPFTLLAKIRYELDRSRPEII